MHKKYIIENNDLSLLPSAYVNLGKGTLVIMRKLISHYQKLKKLEFLLMS